MLNLILGIVIQIIISILLHEWLHYLFAYVLRLNPKIEIHHLIPSITYKNTHDDKKNLIVALAPLLMLLLIYFLPTGKWYIFKVMCICQLFNLLPLTTDGEVILLSIMNLLKYDETK